MGGRQSRGGAGRRAGQGREAELPPLPTSGYFVLSLQDCRVRVVNSCAAELAVITAILQRHCTINKQGWTQVPH